MRRYLVEYHYGNTNGQTILELRSGSESEALSVLRGRVPSDVIIISITPA
jgi:hypothetical protein